MFDKPAPTAVELHRLQLPTGDQLRKLPLQVQCALWLQRKKAGLHEFETPVRKPKLQEAVVYLDEAYYNTRTAAILIGSTYEAMKKWRQRGIGPDYIQERKGGAVRYALSSLLHYRATHTVHPRQKNAA